MGLVLFPHPLLRQKSAPINDFRDPHIHRVIKSLRKLIADQKHGIGAAAPQIGISARIAIVDVSGRDSSKTEIVLINPVILEYQDPVLNREGCMSLPEYRADVARFKRIYIRWHNLSGASQEDWYQGVEAICIQHEVDHLNGLLFIDRVTSLKRDLIPRKR